MTTHDEIPFGIQEEPTITVEKKPMAPQNNVDSGDYVPESDEVRVTTLVAFGCECPQKALAPSVETPATILGTRVHAACADINCGKPVDLTQYSEEERAMIEGAPKFHEPDQLIETRLFYRATPSCVITGSPDVAIPSQVFVPDYKTGRLRFTPESYPQLPVYSYLLVQNGIFPKNRPFKMSYLFVRSGEESTAEWTWDQVQRASEKLIDTWIKHDMTPKMNMYCRFCDRIFSCPVIMEALNSSDPKRVIAAGELLRMSVYNKVAAVNKQNVVGTVDGIYVDSHEIKYQKVDSKLLRAKNPALFKECAKPASFVAAAMSMVGIFGNHDPLRQNPYE